MKAKLFLGTLIGLIFWGQGSFAGAKKGILIVGTQAEVRAILAGSGVCPVFSEDNASAQVAVALTKNKMTVFERDAVGSILDLVGSAVEGGAAIILEAGTALWELLGEVPGLSTALGKTALEAAVFVLKSGQAVILDGVEFLEQTSLQVVSAVAGLIQLLIGG